MNENANEPKKINIEDIFDIVQKKWQWITIPFLFFMLFGVWLYVVLPRQYEAKTLILVQPQEIPSAYVVSTVSSEVEDRVRTLSQEVMSRSNLEKVITEMDLFTKARAENTPMDIIIQGMRKKIDIQVTGRSRGQVGSFSLTYRGGKPQTVADVTNRLASIFIESNLKLRARQASETTLFLEKQMNDLKTLLETHEKKVQEYRNAHMGELPEQLQSNTATLAQFQTRLETVQRGITDAHNRQLTIQSQLSQMETAHPGSTMTGRDLRLAELKERYDALKGTYTAAHPELKRLEEQIKELEEQRKKPNTLSADPRANELRNQLRTTKAEIQSLNQEVQRIKDRISYYQARVENTPKREQEMTTLMRDYRITQDNYQRLLDRYYEAKRAENMEMRQQGEQFRVLDLAQPPQTPVSPNAKKILLMFAVLGLGSGLGVVLLLEFMDSSIKGVRQLESISGGIPCITAVPLAMTEEDKRKLRMKNMIFLAINLGIVVIGLAAIVISKMGALTIDLPFNLPL